MSRTLVVSDSLVIAATPAALYDRISRPALMGRWSPENLGATLRSADAKPGGEAGGEAGGDEDGARRTEVGDVFDGRNKRGPVRWTTRCTVTVADPGRMVRLPGPRHRSAHPSAARPHRHLGVPLRAGPRRHPGDRDLAGRPPRLARPRGERLRPRRHPWTYVRSVPGAEHQDDAAQPQTGGGGGGAARGPRVTRGFRQPAAYARSTT